jgi:hypothetical protein
MARGHTLGMNRLEATSRIVRVVAAVLLVSLAIVSLHHLKDWRLHRVEASAERKLCMQLQTQHSRIQMPARYWRGVVHTQVHRAVCSKPACAAHHQVQTRFQRYATTSTARHVCSTALKRSQGITGIRPEAMRRHLQTFGCAMQPRAVCSISMHRTSMVRAACIAARRH